MIDGPLSDAELREEGLVDHVDRMEFAFKGIMAWCDVLSAMSDDHSEVNPHSLYLIAEAVEGLVKKASDDWRSLVADVRATEHS